MKIVDLADHIFRDLEEDSSISLASIASFLRNRMGDLNNLLNKSYQLTSSYELADSDVEIDDKDASIFKQLYFIYFYGRKYRTALGAGSTEVTNVVQDGINVRITSKTDQAKIFLQLQKESKEDLKQLLNNYKFGKAQPVHIVGDDTISKYDAGE